MRVIIAGSRSAVRYSDLIEAIAVAELVGIVPTTVISGTAHGADQLGERWAQEHHIPLEQYPADWRNYGKRAGILRNSQMAKKADALIALWDGMSTGTAHMIHVAQRRKLEVVVWRTK